MKLQNLKIEGFRGIESLELTFDERLTVLVGENGAGKTTVLDALAILLGYYLSACCNDLSARKIESTDIRHTSDRAFLDIQAIHENSLPFPWTLIRLKQSKQTVGKQSTDGYINPELHKYCGEKFINNINLPDSLLVYFGQKRAILKMEDKSDADADLRPIAAFSGALDSDLDFSDFLTWFRDRRLWETQQWEPDDGSAVDTSQRDKQLAAVRNSITVMTGLENPRFKLVEDTRGLWVTKNGSPLQVSQLSSGEQSLLALAGDLARRLTMLNPDLEDPLQGSGIVLIDEVELHLHPRWQRQILPGLLRAFPNCQFVVTTHSAQVLGMVEAKCVRVLKADESGKIGVSIPRTVRGLDSNSILLGVLGAEERDEEIKGRLNRLSAAIGEGNLAEAETLLKELREEIEGEPPELTIAQMRLDRRRERQSS